MIAVEFDRVFNLDVLIADERMQLSGQVPMHWLCALIGALSADPYTWDELWHAAGRFAQECELPPDLGLTRRPISATSPAGMGVRADELACLIDLPGRMLLTTWNQTADPVPVAAFEGDFDNVHEIRYSLGPEWLISSDFSLWQRKAQRRRVEQAKRWSADFRTTLYGTTLLKFLIERAEPWIAQLRDVDTTPGGSPSGENWRAVRSSAVRGIYQEWLDERPDGLLGRSVRDILQIDQEHLSSDLFSREVQWSLYGRPPRELRDTDTAYRFAGVGPHESVLYDELVGVLVDAYLTRAEPLGPDVREPPAEVDWLRQQRDEWLWKPDSRNLLGKTPREVIAHERRRRPFVVEDGSHFGHDEDCPLCQMMVSAEFGPVFCHLDACSHGLSAVRAGLDEEDDDHLPDDDCGNDHPGRSVEQQPLSARAEAPDQLRLNSVWKRVGLTARDGEPPLAIGLFTVAACTAELIQDLCERSADRESVESLKRHVSNVSESLRNASPDMLRPVVARFCEFLDEVEQDYQDLAEKVEDLQSRLMSLTPLS